MENQIATKIDFKRVLPASLILGTIVFAVQFLITYVLTGNYNFSFSFLNWQTIVLSIGSIFIYYYLYALFLASVFVYIRSSLPIEYKKAGLTFSLILLLVGSAPYSIFKLIPSLLQNNPYSQDNFTSQYFAGILSTVLSLLFVGYLISYYFEKFYKNAKN